MQEDRNEPSEDRLIDPEFEHFLVTREQVEDTDEQDESR